MVLHGPETTGTNSASMLNTAFNISGFKQLEKMLMSSDADGFNDRQLFCFPPQRDVFLGEFKLPLPSHLPASAMCMKLFEHSTVNNARTRLLMKVI